MLSFSYHSLIWLFPPCIASLSLSSFLFSLSSLSSGYNSSFPSFPSLSPLLLLSELFDTDPSSPFSPSSTSFSSTGSEFDFSAFLIFSKSSLSDGLKLGILWSPGNTRFFTCPELLETPGVPITPGFIEGIGVLLLSVK